MDRFFLRALVREVSPQLLGRRVRTLKPWGDAGLVILLGPRRGADLVISLSPQSPGFYVGRPPVTPEEAPRLSRLQKLLSGAELLRMEAAALDRVLTLCWRQDKPSGASRTMDLVVEWPGTRTAAILVDSVTHEVLDVVSPGTPRTVAGEEFKPLALPPGSREVATDRKEFLERLTEARRKGLTEARAFREASGLSSLLVDEMRALAAASPLSIEEAFEKVAGRLGEAPQPVLLSPAASEFHKPGYRLALSPVVLSATEKWLVRKFSKCNEAAADFVSESHRLSGGRALYLEAKRELHKRSKRATKLERRLSSELDALPEPGELRRRGEILLAGLSQAKRMDREEEVLVPDPYQRDSPMVRVPIDRRLDLAGNARRYFARARKVVRSRERLEARLVKTREEREHLETLELALEDAMDLEAFGALGEELEEAGVVAVKSPTRARAVRAKKAASGLAPRRFRLSSGRESLAGRSARSNEELTFRIAGPDDLWFHAAAAAGAHVVLRLPSGTRAGGGDIEEAAAVAAFFSKARGATAAEVLYTARKNVRKLPGAPPGTVRVTRFRTVRVRPALPSTLEETAADADRRAGPEKAK